MTVVDVDGIHAARRYVKSTLAQALEPVLRARYEALGDDGPYDKAPAAMAKRGLRNVCLSYLMEIAGGAALANRQLARSDNMTDTLAALQGLAWTRSEDAAPALAEFESRWREDPLVMDKWFAIQASVPGAATVERVCSLLSHEKFSLKNPNKVRSLLGVFAHSNPTAFHAGDGSGYRLFADQVMALDALNPQTAARQAGAFNPWTRHDSSRKALMKAELLRIAALDGLSPDVSEIVGNAIRMDTGGIAK
jgi:aminopeptidase N